MKVTLSVKNRLEILQYVNVIRSTVKLRGDVDQLDRLIGILPEEYNSFGVSYDKEKGIIVENECDNEYDVTFSALLNDIKDFVSEITSGDNDNEVFKKAAESLSLLIA